TGQQRLAPANSTIWRPGGATAATIACWGCCRRCNRHPRNARLPLAAGSATLISRQCTTSCTPLQPLFAVPLPHRQAVPASMLLEVPLHWTYIACCYTYGDAHLFCCSEFYETKYGLIKLHPSPRCQRCHKRPNYYGICINATTNGR
ncbi:unnamed protein product, partial [Acanthoscelides obtectus]